MSIDRLPPDIEPGKEREHYEPGKEHPTHQLGHHIAQMYLNCKETYNERALKLITDYFLPELGELAEGEGSAVLNTLCQRLEAEATGVHVQNISYLMAPLLNELYERGHNDFTLDFALLRDFPEYMLRHVKGSEDELMDLTCIIPQKTWQKGCEVGKFSHYLNMKITGGLLNVGCWSKNSDFTIGSEVRQIGFKAHNSVFRLQGIDSYEMDRAEENQFVDYEPVRYIEMLGSFSGLSIYQFSDCYRLTLKHGDDTFLSYLDKEFYDNGNRLLIPDNKGGWKEVTP